MLAVHWLFTSSCFVPNLSVSLLGYVKSFSILLTGFYLSGLVSGITIRLLVIFITVVIIGISLLSI